MANPGSRPIFVYLFSRIHISAEPYKRGLQMLKCYNIYHKRQIRKIVPSEKRLLIVSNTSGHIQNLSLERLYFNTPLYFFYFIKYTYTTYTSINCNDLANLYAFVENYAYSTVSERDAHVHQRIFLLSFLMILYFLCYLYLCQAKNCW